MRPMLASPGALPTSEPGAWAFEVKWDGMRVLASRRGDGLRLTTRTEADATDRFPEIAGALGADLPAGSVLDGEVVALDERGRPSFSLLAPRIQSRASAAGGVRPVTFVVFDLLRLGSEDLLPSPYTERRRRLVDAVDPAGPVVVADSFEDGPALLRTTAEQGLEGVVAKRRGSTYQPGVRSKDWVKVPHRVTHSFVIGGWKSRRDTPGRLASVLVGTPVGDRGLLFDGAVGSGLRSDDAGALLAVLRDIETEGPCFEVDRVAAERSDELHWVEPILVVDVVHLGRSSGGLLRQPTVARLRPDLSYDDVAEGAES